MGLEGPSATGVQATLGVIEAGVGLGIQNSLIQPRTPTGAKSHVPGVFTHNGESLEFDKAVINRTPNIDSTTLTSPIKVTKSGSACKECGSINHPNIEHESAKSSVKEDSKSQSSFLP